MLLDSDINVFMFFFCLSIVCIQHDISFRYTIYWFKIYIHYNVIATPSLVIIGYCADLLQYYWHYLVRFFYWILSNKEMETFTQSDCFPVSSFMYAYVFCGEYIKFINFVWSNLSISPTVSSPFVWNIFNWSIMDIKHYISFKSTT